MHQTRSWRPRHRVDVALTLGSLRRGAGDPAYFLDSSGAVWRVARYPSGPATLRLIQSAGTVSADAWGPGAEHALDGLPDLLGDRDDAGAFTAGHPLVDALHRRHPGLRIGRTGLVLEALVPAILEQKVTGREARRSWRELLWRYGEPAPGPVPVRMWVPPPAPVWASISSWEWHRAGVDAKRSQAVVSAARVAGRLERTLDLPPADAERRLHAVPGVGSWTVAEVTARAHGNTDAVSVGDYHLPSLVGAALTGRPTDDAGMLALLAPWQPHRYRVVRLLEIGARGQLRALRRGPRAPIRDYREL